MAYAGHTVLLIAALCVVLGICIMDCAADVRAAAAFGWNVVDPDLSAIAAAGHEGLGTAAAYYTLTTGTPHVHVAVLGSIGVLALGVLFRVASFGDWRSWVLLSGLGALAPYFVGVMGPAEESLAHAEGEAVPRALLAVLRGRAALMAVVALALALLASETLPAPTAGRKPKTA